MSEKTPQAIRAQALESLLIEKGLLSAEEIDDVIATYNDRVGPMNGARVVAKAWLDPVFKKRLLADATSEINSFKFEGGLCRVEEKDAVNKKQISLDLDFG